MAKKKSLFTYKNGRQPSNTNAYKNLQKLAKEARSSRFKRTFTPAKVEEFKQKVQDNPQKYRGTAAHDRYSQVMDRIPEDERAKYRELVSDETFYWGEQIIKENIDFDTINEAFDSYQQSLLKDLEELSKLVPPDIPLPF